MVHDDIASVRLRLYCVFRPEHDRQVAERAWDEAKSHTLDGIEEGRDPDVWALNPYRKEAAGGWPPPKSRDEIRKGAIDEIAEVLEKKEVTGD